MAGRRNITPLMIGLALLTTPLKAAESLSLAEAIRAALAADPAVAAAEADLAAARASVGEAEAALEPQLGLAASAQRFEEPMVITPIHGFTPGQFPEFDETLLQSSVTGSYLLYDGGATRARVRQARAQRSATAATVDTARQALIARTAATYFAVLSRARTLAAHDLRTRALEAELARVQQLHEVGRAAAVEILRVEAALAAAEAERVDVAAQLDVAERALARLTALPADRTSAAALAEVSLESRELPPREQVMSITVEASPLVQQMRSRVNAQRAAISFARAGRYPQLNLVGAFTEFGSSEGFLTGEWNAGMQLRMSLFDGGATGERVARARALAAAAEEQLRAVERDVRDAVDRAVADLTQALATVESLEKAVERFAEVARIERLRLENGVGTQTDYLRAEADLLQARAGLAAARYRAMLARVELARISGTLDAEWIEKTFRSES